MTTHLINHKLLSNKRRNIAILIALLILATISIIIVVLVLLLKQKNVPNSPTNSSIPEVSALLNTDDQFAVDYKQKFETEHNDDEDDKDPLPSDDEIKSFNETIKSIFEQHITGKLPKLYIDQGQVFERFNKNIEDARDLWEKKSQHSIDKLCGIWEAIIRSTVSPPKEIKTITDSSKDLEPVAFTQLTVNFMRTNYFSQRITYSLINKQVKTIQELQNHVFYKYVSVISQILELTPEFLLKNQYINWFDFNIWVSKSSNTIKLISYSKNIDLVTGLPLFMIYLFVREDIIKKQYSTGNIHFGQNKEDNLKIQAVMNSKELENKDWNKDIVIGKFYQLFSLIKKRNEKKNEEADKVILKLISELNTSLKAFTTEITSKKK